MKISRILPAVLALALAPALAQAQTDTSDMKGSSYTLWKLHQIDLLEIKLGGLAKDNAQSAAVKSYADKIVSDHKAADEKVTAQAKKLKVDLDAKPAPSDKAEQEQHEATAGQLKALKGGAFDAKYVQAMMDGHKQAVEFVTTARSEAAQAELKPLLDELLPQLKQHEQMAMRLGNGQHGLAAPPQGRRPGDR